MAGPTRAESEPLQVLAAITLGPALDAIAFLRYLKSPDAVQIFTRLGYAAVP